MSDSLMVAISKITIEEFSDFLSSKKISNNCRICGEPALKINVQSQPEKKHLVRVIEAPVYGDSGEVFPLLMRSCSNCFSIEQYGALLTLNHIEKTKKQEKNNAPE